METKNINRRPRPMVVNKKAVENIGTDTVRNFSRYNSATIKGVLNEVYGIENKAINGLTIKLIGSNRIDCNDVAMIINANTTITGDGTLSVASNYEPAISFYRESLTFDNCDLTIKGRVGIGGGGVENQSLTIRNSNVTVDSSNGCIDIINSFTLEGCSITEPADAYFSTERHGVVYANGSVVMKKLIISKDAPAMTYDLKIAGVQVTSANCDDLSVIPGVSGTVKYYPSDKTLYLEDAKIETTANVEGIFSKIDGLTIMAYGDNTIKVGGFSAIKNANSHCTIIGEKLNLSGGYFGLYVMRRASMTIKYCTIESDGSVGTNNDDAKITIRNSKLTAKSKLTA